jgi:hypothetical protein
MEFDHVTNEFYHMTNQYLYPDRYIKMIPYFLNTHIACAMSVQRQDWSP